MANFSTIVNKTLNFEGGYQAYPNDSANYTSTGQLVGTNRGISAIAYESYLGFPPTASQMQAITPGIAKAVYKKLFWDKMQGDKLKSDSVAWIIFDSYIATGSLKLSRQGINDAGGEVDTGNVPFNNYTLSQIHKLPAQVVFDAIKKRNIEQRTWLAESNPDKYGMFLDGWLNRLNNITFTDIATGGSIIVVIVFVVGLGWYISYQNGKA